MRAFQSKGNCRTCRWIFTRWIITSLLRIGLVIELGGGGKARKRFGKVNLGTIMIRKPIRQILNGIKWCYFLCFHIQGIKMWGDVYHLPLFPYWSGGLCSRALPDRPPPARGQNDWHTFVKILLRLRAVTMLTDEIIQERYLATLPWCQGNATNTLYSKV